MPLLWKTCEPNFPTGVIWFKVKFSGKQRLWYSETGKPNTWMRVPIPMRPFAYLSLLSRPATNYDGDDEEEDYGRADVKDLFSDEAPGILIRTNGRVFAPMELPTPRISYEEEEDVSDDQAIEPHIDSCTPRTDCFEYASDGFHILIE